jgi:hypothetical protein
MTDLAKLPAWRCGCCGEDADDLRPHTFPPSGWGACFRCGMAGARYQVGRSCRRCQGKPAVDQDAVTGHNMAKFHALGVY